MVSEASPDMQATANPRDEEGEMGHAARTEELKRKWNKGSYINK
jgi:hypothetical protein